MGRATVTQVGAPGEKTKECERYHWGIGLGPIAMEQCDMYVDDSTTPAVPFFSSQAITPFNGPKIGVENASFIQFTPMTDFGTNFDIDPASIASCPAPSNGCGDDQTKAALAAMPLASHTRFQKTIAMVALDHLAAGTLPKEAHMPLPAAVEYMVGAGLSWKDYTSAEDIKFLVSQGGARNAAGDSCCSARQPGQCQVQSQRLKGTRYHDVTNQRSRFDVRATRLRKHAALRQFQTCRVAPVLNMPRCASIRPCQSQASPRALRQSQALPGFPRRARPDPSGPSPHRTGRYLRLKDRRRLQDEARDARQRD